MAIDFPSLIFAFVAVKKDNTRTNLYPVSNPPIHGPHDGEKFNSISLSGCNLQLFDKHL